MEKVAIALKKQKKIRADDLSSSTKLMMFWIKKKKKPLLQKLEGFILKIH